MSGAHPSDDYLLALFVDDVKRKLEASVIEAIRPNVRAAVASTVASLQPRLQSFYDMKSNEMLVQIALKEIK